MSAAPQPRLAFDPVFAHIGNRNIVALARRLSQDPKAVHRWVNDGITHAAADEVATALGCHPSQLWPDWGGVPIPAPNRAGQRSNLASVPPGKPQIGLVAEEPPEEPRTLPEQVEAVVADGLDPGRWYRVAVMPSSRSAKALATRMGKRDVSKRMVLEWRAAGLKLYVRGPK